MCFRTKNGSNGTKSSSIGSKVAGNGHSAAHKGTFSSSMAHFGGYCKA
jgi:hypothetical protein